MIRLAAVLAVVSLLVAGCSSPSGNSKVPAGAKSSGGKHATIVTDKGPVEIEFLESSAPRAVENFRLLAEHGYYDGLTFHRIVKGFMIQGGDPTGTGTGGESAWGEPFPDEIDPQSEVYRRGYRRGIVAMANAGPNTNGSQFFVTLVPTPWLDNKHAIFGEVVEGMDIVQRIGKTKTGPGDRPTKDILIESVTIERS